MALTDCVKINITNNAELHINMQYVFAFIYAIRPQKTFSTYNPKQKEFKVKKT